MRHRWRVGKEVRQAGGLVCDWLKGCEHRPICV